MALPPLSRTDIIAIRHVNKKLRLGPAKLVQLEQAQKQGVPADEALANLLGLGDGEDPKTFLQKKLSRHEYEVLKRFLGYAKDGSPLTE